MGWLKEVLRRSGNRKPDPWNDDTCKDPDEKQSPMDDQRPSIAVSGDPEFTPSYNGRVGWSPHDVYDTVNKAILGEGGFGKVYKCHYRDEVRLQRLRQSGGCPLDFQKGVAIKLPKEETPIRSTGSNPYDDLVEQNTELQTLLNLRGVSGVLQMHEYYYVDRKLILVTEVLGSDLGRWLTQQEVCTEYTIRDIARTVLGAIEHMHELQIAHRDLKPPNILVGVDNDILNLKIVDFGLAKDLRYGNDSRFCGTYGYIAPEIYEKASYGCEVDMFAFGVILFRLLSSGDRPFPHKNRDILRQAVLRLEYDIHEGWDQVSADAKRLVKHLLTHRENRLSATEALREPWFDMTEDPSMLQTFWQTSEEIDRDDERAVLLSRHPSSQRPASGCIWLDPELAPALSDLISSGVYRGNVLGILGEGNASRLVVNERLSERWMQLPDYVPRLGSYSEGECRAVFSKILQAVQSFHRAGLCHRYIHMENIIVDTQGNVKLTGIKYVHHCNRPLSGHFNRKFSWYAFLAPEINRDFSHDSRVDLWSLGAVLYTLLCGIFPFSGGMDTLRLNKESGSVEFEVVPVSPDAQDLVRCLLQPDPDRRILLGEIWTHKWMVTDESTLRRRDLKLARTFLSSFSDKVI